MTPSEKIIEKYLHDRVTEVGGTTFKFVSPGMKGVPDRVCLHPAFGVAFIECKTKAGKLSIHQRKCFARISAAGSMVFVINSKSAVDNFIDDLILHDESECQCPECVGAKEDDVRLDS